MPHRNVTTARCDDRCHACGQKILRRRKATAEDFWSLVEKAGPDECWIFKGTKKGSYGVASFNGQTYPAHRLAFMLTHRASVDGPMVCHRCDVRMCVNPAHLFLGTAADNMADKVTKGRQARGESNGTAKLTADDVRAIRACHAAGQSALSLGRLYGVSHNNVLSIVKRQTWRDI
jgi:hypothetical protein